MLHQQMVQELLRGNPIIALADRCHLLRIIMCMLKEITRREEALEVTGPERLAALLTLPLQLRGK